MYETFQPKDYSFSRFLLFTGKGGVGKTSTACATAIDLADQGKKVLIVSTDPASNLDDVFEMEISNKPVAIPKVPNLFASNLDPEVAAKAYREKVIGPYKGKLPDSVLQTMEEQLSGACTVEIAAFDEFTNLLADPHVTNEFDHVIFDTAPTGHTLRLLQLPTAWSGFLNDSSHGASCLGPLAGLDKKKELYAKTVQALANPELTTLVLVSRPEDSALLEAGRASKELFEVGLENQMLLLNGLLTTYDEADEVASAFYSRQMKALEGLPNELKNIKTYKVPLVAYNLTGLDALRKLFVKAEMTAVDQATSYEYDGKNLKDMIEAFSNQGKGIIFTMGKGGVGKTTIASLLAVGLAEKGHQVHLTTTDPAAHLSYVFQDEQIQDKLNVSRIDPKQEVENYRNEVLEKAKDSLDESGLAYLEEDLRSPCTEEIAVFRAFAEVCTKAEKEFVVIDTAPTGHTLLLLDAAQSYHKELERSTGEIPESVQKLLPRLRNSEETSVVIVTLPEATPVLEASRLQEDLIRAGIKPSWWVINQSLLVTHTNDPVLKGRGLSEIQWINKVEKELSKKSLIVPWVKEEAIGYDKLKQVILM